MTPHRYSPLNKLKVDIYINFTISLFPPISRERLIFLSCLCFLRRAPVRILSQYRRCTVGWYPSSLSLSSKSLTSKQQHSTSTNKAKACGGFWLFTVSENDLRDAKTGVCYIQPPMNNKLSVMILYNERN